MLVLGEAACKLLVVCGDRVMGNLIMMRLTKRIVANIIILTPSSISMIRPFEYDMTISFPEGCTMKATPNW